MISLARIGNAFPTLILRSPLHGLLSNRYAIIEFTGRRSGRRYATPIAYLRDGDHILLSTDSGWQRNLVGGAQVRLHLRGQTLAGRATALVDPRESEAVIRQLVDAIPSYARLAGLAREDGRVSDAEIARAVNQGGRVGISVVLESGS